MVKHYDDLIFSKVVKEEDYFFKNLEFGKSNTDQSFYEPMASMIQNAQKIGSVSSSLHNDSEKTIAQIRETSDFLPNYMTQEEIQSMIVSQSEKVEQSINSVNEQVQVLKNEVISPFSVVQKSTEIQE